MASSDFRADRPSADDADYAGKLATESAYWGAHLDVEATGEWNAWLDHPAVAEHYYQRALIDGLRWEPWVARTLGGPARRSLDLGCGSGVSDLRVYEQKASAFIEGIDIAERRVAEANRWLALGQFPGDFRTGDANQIQLEEKVYDLIFSVASFHHFWALEHVMEQVHRGLTPNGLFVLEEYVGPTQFQWTEAQMEIVRSLMALLPERLRQLRWGALKTQEGRPSIEDLLAHSPFESIRSAEIVPLFRKYFDVVACRPLGGAIQHLLYNGIIHNFRPEDPEALGYLKAIWQVEDALTDAGLLACDFMLIIGKRRDQ